MKKVLFLFLSLIFLILAFNFFFKQPSFVLAEDCVSTCTNLLDCQTKMESCQHAWDLMEQAIKPHEEDLRKMEADIANFQKRIKQIEGELAVKEKEIKKGDENLAVQEEVLAQRVRHFYIRSYYDNPLVLIFSKGNAASFLRELAYQRAVTNEDKKKITEIALYLKDLETKKQQLETEKTGLASIKAETDKRAESVRKLLKEANAYQQKLAGSISSLQTAILAAKGGGFTASVGDSELADDYNASIKGFRESAPSGSFAVFSFGAYTHRKGMSQYGARGRAGQGKNYREILRAYYGKEPVNKDTGGSISVSGYGSMDFETTYLYGIAEMPSSWGSEALKAQAVAARSFALRYKQNGTTICADEGCQVFNKGKSNNPPSAWKQAVEETRGQVLEDVVTYYSSTTGGFITTMGWDTTDGSGGSNFFDKSYEKLGGSPWAYKAWYTKGYDVNSDKCGRSNPWLTAGDLADIVNAALVLKNTNDERITPTTTSCWGGNPYNQDELKNVARQYGGINSVDSVSVIQGDGTTNEVVINGSVRLSGADFKKGFNLRAPGYLKIPQSGFSFFNIEKK